MLQVLAAVSSITLATVVGVKGLLGLGPAIVLASGALAAMPAGRLMDRVGRVPVLSGGFGVGIGGCILAAAGSTTKSATVVLLGLAAMGAAGGVALLTRTAAADMYPPQHRARGIALVLFGSVFGSILGPFVFGPLVRGRVLDGESLALLWLAGAGFMVVGLGLVLSVRPDPKRISALIDPHDAAVELPPAPLRVLLKRPGVVPALVAAQASFAVMVAVMWLTGSVVVDHQHHSGTVVFPIIGAHFFGMYALVLIVGDIIDRVGRKRALVGGLILMGAAAASLSWVESVPATAASLFALGLGWNFSFVAATAEMADRTASNERGRLIGFNDLLSGLTGAVLALAGGVALEMLGVAALAVGATLLVLGPAVWILSRKQPAILLDQSA